MASSYLSPGVYMEEVSSGSRPIEAAGTAVAAFVGFAEKGPLNQPMLVTNWTQFTQNFGGFIAGSYLAHSVYGYFANGGGSAYVVRVGSETVAEAPVLRGEFPAAEDGRTAFAVRALPAIAGGQPITVEVAPSAEPSEETFTLIVKRGGAVVEAMEGLTVRRGPSNVATAVKQQSKLIEVEETRGSRVLARASRSRSRSPRTPPRYASSPTSTSATPPTAPGSPDWRRSTRSPCCRCRT